MLSLVHGSLVIAAKFSNIYGCFNFITSILGILPCNCVKVSKVFNNRFIGCFIIWFELEKERQIVCEHKEIVMCLFTLSPVDVKPTQTVADRSWSNNALVSWGEEEIEVYTSLCRTLDSPNNHELRKFHLCPLGKGLSLG